MIIWCMICLYGYSTWYGYFEHIYQCTLSGSGIHITLQAQDHSYNCMNVVKFLHEKEQAYNQQIRTLEDYDHSEEPLYRSKLSYSLHNNYNHTKSLREAIVSKVEQFEKDLFINVKKVVLYKLNTEFIKLNNQKKYTDKVLHTMISQWKSIDLISTQQLYQDYLIKLTLRKGMQDTEDFATLMAYLQLYKKI